MALICDSSCQNATGPKCECPCMGILHGIAVVEGNDGVRRKGFHWAVKQLAAKEPKSWEAKTGNLKYAIRKARTERSCHGNGAAGRYRKFSHYHSHIRPGDYYLEVKDKYRPQYWQYTTYHCVACAMEFLPDQVGVPIWKRTAPARAGP